MHRILLVEDDASTMLVMKHGLRRFGFDVLCAGDGEEAWTVLLTEKPDLILADYRMPRLDGLELAERVKENSQTSSIPVILFTCKGFELSVDEIRRKYGVVALLPKPYNPRVYASVIERAITANLIA